MRGKPRGTIGTCVDDTTSAGTNEFIEETTLTEKSFESKNRSYDNFTFAGVQVEKVQDGYLLHQENYARRLKELSKDRTFADFRSRRHELMWLTNTRPNICVDVNICCQVTEKGSPRKTLKLPPLSYP